MEKPGDPARGSDKVSARIRAVVHKMEERGITRQNARELGASSFSTTLVKINEEGEIQANIHVSTLGEAEKDALRTYGVRVEIAREERGLVQGWVPFDRIDEVARLPFVKQISPPHYGIPDAGSVTTEGDAVPKTK